jgi:hypothetical protein
LLIQPLFRSKLVAAILSILGLAPTAATAADYAEGQVWKYKTRAGEEASRVVILKIDEVEGLGRIYSVSIIGLKLAAPRNESGFQEQLPHAPVSEKTLNESVTELVGEAAASPEFYRGYDIWKEAFDRGAAGVYTVTLSEIVDFIEITFKQMP